MKEIWGQIWGHNLNRLTRIKSVSSALSVVDFQHAYNAANQRTNIILGPDNSHWDYAYDALGQVTSGKKHWPDGSSVAGQQFEYQFDSIGNRKQTQAGGDNSGQNLRAANYTNNLLNQITGRDVPGAADILGIAHASATVTVNGQSTSRKGEYYWKGLGISNQLAAIYQGVTNTAYLAGTTNTTPGSLLLPMSPQRFFYDADGNLLSDGVWTNTWDAENRLISTETTAAVPQGARAKETWSYYPDGRWAERVIYAWTNSAWTAQTTQRFVWDGNLIVAVLDVTAGSIQTFLRGLDLSGTIQGAGGAGGLLLMTDGLTGLSYLHAHDGNGNVVALVNFLDGTVAARYEYGPFAEPIRMTGSFALANPMRFSGQFADDVRGTLKYLYREYDESIGRWLTADPIGEQLAALRSNDAAQINPLYSFSLNDPVDSGDYLGLACWVFYDCINTGEQNNGWVKSCFYSCVEKVTAPRETRFPGETSCEDLEAALPKPHLAKYTDTTARCLSCAKTAGHWMAYDESWKPITDCSRAKCLKDLNDEVLTRISVTCALLKGPARTACNATARAIQAAGTLACDRCKKP